MMYVCKYFLEVQNNQNLAWYIVNAPHNHDQKKLYLS